MLRATLVASGAVLGAAIPAQAAVIPVPEAADEVAQACAASADALRSGGGRIDQAIEEYDVGGLHHMVYDSNGILYSYSDPVSPMGESDRPSQTRRYVVDGVGTYQRLEFSYGWLTEAQRKRVLKRYLKRPAVRYYRVRNQYPLSMPGEWTREFGQSFDSLTERAMCSPDLDERASGADRTANGDGQVWTFDFLPDSERHEAYVADGEGRLTANREYYGDPSADDAYTDGWDFSYGPRTLSAPTAKRTVSWRRYSRAGAAVTLNADLRKATRAAAKDFNDGNISTVRELRQRLQSLLDIYGHDALPLKYSSVARGGIGYRTNPFTRTYHAWSVTVRNDVATARKVSP